MWSLKVTKGHAPAGTRNECRPVLGLSACGGATAACLFCLLLLLLVHSVPPPPGDNLAAPRPVHELCGPLFVVRPLLSHSTLLRLLRLSFSSDILVHLILCYGHIYVSFLYCYAPLFTQTVIRRLSRRLPSHICYVWRKLSPWWRQALRLLQ
jgi:hypothetical protein